MKQEAPFLHLPDSFSNSFTLCVCIYNIYIYIFFFFTIIHICNLWGKTRFQWNFQHVQMYFQMNIRNENKRVKDQRNLRFSLKDSRRFFWVPAGYFFWGVPIFTLVLHFGCLSMLLFEDIHRCRIFTHSPFRGLE